MSICIKGFKFLINIEREVNWDFKYLIFRYSFNFSQKKSREFYMLNYMRANC